MILNPTIQPATAATAGKSTRSPLATVDGVAGMLDKPVQTVYARADGGDEAGECLQWVWNVSTNPRGKIRNLRFWVPEVQDARAVAGLSLEQVIDTILPASRREFPAGTVCQFLQIRPITLSYLRGELGGEVRGNSGFYPRPGLVKFFKTRWLGAASGASRNPI
ncbi:MAG: hypothetical protein P4N60_22150 [Verrucomicrobiae bacterium]|nr:hypothetical protein [Verrucomicrobiae bacterium]